MGHNALSLRLWCPMKTSRPSKEAVARDAQLAFSTYSAGRSRHFMYRFTRNRVRAKPWRSAAVAQPCKIHIVLVLRLRLSCNNTCSLTTTSSPPKGVCCDGWAQRHYEMQRSICEYRDANHDSAIDVRTYVCHCYCLLCHVVCYVMVGMQPKVKD